MHYETNLAQSKAMAQAWANTFPSTPNAGTAFLDWLNTVPQQGGSDEETVIITHPK